MADTSEKPVSSEKFMSDADVEPVSISRSGPSLPLAEIAECDVYDEEEKPHRFGSFYDGSVAIVVFVRHFLCYVCKEYVEDLALIKHENLHTAAGEPVRLIVIGCAKPKFIESFRKATSYRGELYVDPSRSLYAKFGLVDKMSMSSAKGSSPHVRSSLFTGFMKSFKRMIASGEMQGDTMQQGGSFVLGPTTTTCIWAHPDAAPFDHSPINDLLGTVGIPPVDFDAERQLRAK